MTIKNTVLIIDDDHNFIINTKDLLEENDYLVSSVETGKEAITLIQNKVFDIILLDKNLPDTSGLDILEKHECLLRDSIVIMITAEPSIASVVEAIKFGANNYISKPFDDMELLFKIDKEVKFKELNNNFNQLQISTEEKYNLKNIVGKDKTFQEIKNTIVHLKNSDITILITGETGTGKGILAKAIHYCSSRKNKPFVTINAGTLSDNILESELFGHVKGAFTGADKDKTGLFKSANGGTVFIDEIGDMPYKMQIKLLRVLQDKEFEPVGSNKTFTVDVRIITATNQNLEQLLDEKKFRKDLFYRLNVVHFEIPPLRKRNDDLLPLTQYFIQKSCTKNKVPVKKLSSEVLERFINYTWPGNIRELENYIERMVVLERGEEFSIKSLPPKLLADVNEKSINSDIPETETKKFHEQTFDELEKKYLLQLLDKYNGYISKVAEVCGVNRRTIYRKLQKLNIDKKYFK